MLAARRSRFLLLSAVALITSLLVVVPSATAFTANPAVVFINEIHYDNAGTDVGEAVEIAGPAGTDLTGWSVVRYNGSNGLTYGSDTLSGVLADAGSGYGFTTVVYPSNGLQNGSPDGIALVDPLGGVVQFLSYEGVFGALDGPANGLTSTDIGVAESTATGIGQSLQLFGTGSTYQDFIWGANIAETFGLVNSLQTFTGTPQQTVINELIQSTSGTDPEFIELFGSPSASLDGLSIIAVEANGGSTGAIDDRFDFGPGDALGPNGYYLLGVTSLLESVYGVTPDRDFPADTLENSPTTFALVETSSLSGTSVTGGEVVRDAVATTDAAGGTFFFGAPLIGPDGSFLAPGGTRSPDGVDTDTAADWVMASFSDRSGDTPTPGFPPPPPSGPCATAPTLTKISAAQGDGAATPCDGQTITIEGVVVGDYEGSNPNLRGFYVQEEDADQDGDATTSEGIFVFHGNEDTVDLGDLVRVTGTVGEFQDQTQIGFPDEVIVVSGGNTVTPASVSLPLASADALEAVEGMLVVAPQTLYVTEFFQLGRFGQVVVSSGDRLDQPTAIAAPGAAANAIQAANDLNRLIIDDATNDQNPDPIVFGRDGNELTASNTLRGGDTITGTVGVMTYTWAGNSASGNAYRLRPVGDLSDSGLVPGGVVPSFVAANPRPTDAPDVGGDLTVAGFNVLNYFTTVDNGPDICGPGQNEDCRGADSEFELTRQRDKLLSALVKVDGDVVGLIELENTPGADPEDDIADGLNDLLGAGTYSAVDAGDVVGPDAIRVGIIYRPDAVTPLGDPAVLDFSLDSFGEDRSRSAVAQTFIDNGTGQVFTAVVNHFKSKSSSEIGGFCSSNPSYLDCDQGDGQGFFNAIRTTHATELIDWLATDPTGSGDDDVIILGDLNSYAMEDPIVALEAAGYVDLAEAFVTDPYSFVFDGQWGYLDYAMASSSLAAQVTGAAEYHINADEPSVLDYNTNFKSANHVTILYAPDEFRTSDHDPILVGLELDAIDAVATATPDTLWPPNHKLRRVGVTATDGGAPLTVVIVDAASSEADSGLDPEDVPNDIVFVSDSVIRLRAERFALEGRTYTVWLLASSGSQTQLVTATVFVPHDQAGG